jgi:glutathione-regulated potassium-efflux system ancillary protein KefF
MAPAPASAAILVVQAHPYPTRSRACAALLRALDGLPGLEVRSLYDRYPDFDVDVAGEQAALTRADLVLLLHPLYWYSVPGLLKHWFDVVLVKGWAYGEGGGALAGKDCLWVTTTGGDDEAFTPDGRHHARLAQFTAPLEHTARYCGMAWLAPFVLHGAHLVDEAALREAGRQLRASIEAWREARAGRAA